MGSEISLLSRRRLSRKVSENSTTETSAQSREPWTGLDTVSATAVQTNAFHKVEILIDRGVQISEQVVEHIPKPCGYRGFLSLTSLNRYLPSEVDKNCSVQVFPIQPKWVLRGLIKRVRYMADL